VQTLEDLVESAEAMVPVLKEWAAQTESNGCISKATIADFKAAGFFRAFVPKRYGGLELDYGFTQVELCSQIGRACASSAWVLSVDSCPSGYWACCREVESAQFADRGSHV